MTQKVLQRLDGGGPEGRTATTASLDMPMAPRGNKLSKLAARSPQSPDLDANPRAPRA
jgi:hypothetical protein